MELLTVAVVALLASLLTFVSGFGLGTLLMPAMALFMPVEAAVALTAVVHLSANLLKVALVGREADRQVLARFGVAALAGAVLGGWTLTLLGARDRAESLVGYELAGHRFTTTPVAIGVGAVMIAFAVIEMTPLLSRWRPSPRWQPLGGLLSGFLGGLSGHQGAVRSAFLSGMDDKLTAVGFAATGAVLACVVDLARLAMYGSEWQAWSAGRLPMLAAGGSAALLGTWLGARLIQKVTLPFVQRVVAIGLVFLGLGLALGWVR